MKFSVRRKAEMRRTRCKRNLRNWGTGAYIAPNTHVVDIMKSDSNVYLLALNSATSQYSIYKAVSHGETVKLSEKKLINKKTTFQNSDKWRCKSKLTIDENGSISCERHYGPGVVVIEIITAW